MSKPLVGEYLQFKKEPTKELDKNAVTWVRTNSHFKEEVVGHVQQNISMILSMFFPAPSRFGDFCSWEKMEKNTDSKSPRNFIFMYLKRQLNN